MVNIQFSQRSILLMFPMYSHKNRDFNDSEISRHYRFVISPNRFVDTNCFNYQV